jgi:hypothetical protein
MDAIPKWVIVVVAALIVVGLVRYARGPDHHHGDEVGSLGAIVTTVTAAG